MKVKQGNISVDRNAVMKEILMSAENSPQKANLVLTIEEAKLLINEIQKNIEEIKPASQEALNLVSEKMIELEERVKSLEKALYKHTNTRDEEMHRPPGMSPSPLIPPGHTPSRRGGLRQLGVYDG